MRPRYRFIQLMDRWSSLVNARWPRGIGTAGTVAVILASLAYGAVKGDHIPTVVEAFKDARDAAANAAGFRIVSVALAGQHHISREDVLAAAGVTDTHVAALSRRRADARTAQEQSLDRRRHRAQALSGRAADRHQGARGIRALAEGRAGVRHRRRRHRARTLCGAAPDRAAAGGRTRRRDARKGISRVARPLSRRCAPPCAPRSWWASGAGTCG